MSSTVTFNVIIDYNIEQWIKAFLNNRIKTTTITFAVQHWHLARPQLQANTAWNESLHNLLRKRVSLALPCWKLARTISHRPFCTASAICCMLSITRVKFTPPVSNACNFFGQFQNAFLLARWCQQIHVRAILCLCSWTQNRIIDYRHFEIEYQRFVVCFPSVCSTELLWIDIRVTAFSQKWKIPSWPDFSSFSRPSGLHKV